MARSDAGGSSLNLRLMSGGLDDHSDQDHEEGGCGTPDVAWVPWQRTRQCIVSLMMFAQNEM